MALHDVSILFLLVLIGAVNAVVLAWAALLGARREPALYWSAGCVLLALCAGSVFLIPDPASPWRAPLFNIPIVASYACWLAGVLRFCERPLHAPWLIGVVLLGAAISLWFSLVDPQRDLRVFLAAGLGAGLRLTTAWVLARYRGGHDRRVAWLTASVLAMEALVLIDHALAAAQGQVPVIGSAGLGGRNLTWLSMLLATVVSTPLLMLLGLSRLLNELRELAQIDSLTRLPNRRGFSQRTRALLAQGARNRNQICVLMIDVDHFKRLNDRFGHAVGDQVLRVMGSVLLDQLRGADVAVRWGGEEFCALLPGASAAEGGQIADRIRRAFHRQCAELASLKGEPVTLSAGIAAGQLDRIDFEALQQQADHALYQAKRQGRDRIEATAIGAPPADAADTPTEHAV